MTYYLQETDSRIIHHTTPQRQPSWPPQLRNETYGGELRGSFGLLPKGPNLTRRASEIARKAPNQAVVDQATTLLRHIQSIVSTFQQLGLDISQVPQLGGAIAGDGSLLLEWVFEHYRIGFNVEINPDESGWYLITDRTLGEISASGFTTNGDSSALLLWLLNFVVSH